MAETKNGIRVKQKGTVRIAEEVVATIAFLASIQAPGVADGTSKSDLIQDCTVKKSLLKGARVRFLQKETEIDIQISVDCATPAVLAAKKVQSCIKTDIENMTGLHVGAVNVTVASIRL